MYPWQEVMSRNISSANFLSDSFIVEDEWTLPKSVLAIVLISLIIKLFLINLNKGEYTDGIIQLQLWSSPVVFFPPGYSALVWLVDQAIGNLLMSGRLVSIFASVAGLWMFYYLARWVLNDRDPAVWATLFLSLSPIFNRWSLRVMTDALFLTFFIICCIYSLKIVIDKRSYVTKLIFFTGCATLVRYQGLFFVPFILYGIWINKNATANKAKSIYTYIYGVASLLPWLAVGWWLFARGFGHTQQFIDRASHGFWVTLTVYYAMFETFLLYWPWAVTYSLFALGIVGLMNSFNANTRYKEFLIFFALTAAVFLVVQSCFLSYQYRYLLPLVPLWCIVSARGWGVFLRSERWSPWKKPVMYLILLNLLGMTGAVWRLQRDTFGDLAESAEFLNSAKYERAAKPDTRVLSDEIYRDGIYNVKMKFWANQFSQQNHDILLYSETSLRVGDVLILHNCYSDLERVKEQLDERFQYTVLHTWNNYRTVPLLPDIMVFPTGVPLTSNPPCMAFRFTTQNYYSVALQLTAEK